MLACFVENHFLSQITKFVTCSLFRFWDNWSLQQFCGNTQTETQKLSTVPSAHAGEGNKNNMVCAGNFGWKLQDTILDAPYRYMY